MKTLCLIITFAMFLLACNRENKNRDEATELKQEKIDSIRNSLNALNDSVALSWNRLEKNYDTIHFTIKRFLDEVSYMKKYDKSEYQSLRNQLEAYKTQTLTREKMSVSDSIDNYDQRTDSLINRVREFGNKKLPEIAKYPLAGQLLEELSDFQQKIYLLRVRHDFHAMDFNKIVEDYKKDIVKSDPQADTLKKVPIFLRQQ
jgi:hypothetical protein